MVSCENPDSCGRYKENRWKDTFINPVEEDPEACFRYSAEGKIREDNERVKVGRLKTLFSGIIFCPLSGPEKIYKTACSGQTALMK